MGSERSLLLRFKRHWISAVLFLIPLALYLIGTLSFHMPELYQHIMLTITAVMGIHVLDRLVLVKDTEEALGTLVKDVRDDIGSQSASLVSTSKSLQAMDQCGIVQIYPSRVAAAPDLRADIVNPGNSRVRLMGISLNDFVQGMDQTLLEAWNTIQAFVRGQKAIDDQKRGLDVRMLIIDPFCFGAVMRSESESESSAALAKRLETDVQAAARDLQRLAQQSDPKGTGVKFECRMYRLPPIMFLCWVDSVCYVQQYHFWSARDNRTPTPVLKFRSLPASPATYPYHAEMDHHFDWIWKHASISLADYLDGAAVGTELGTQQTGAVNVYTDPQKGSDRIAYLLKRASTKVSLQGISLNSFFKPGPLREAIEAVLENDGTELEILILDPKSEQASFRSYRECLFASPNEGYSEYVAHGAHDRSDLFHDTNRTIANIGQMIADVRARKSASWKPRLKVGLYDSAPACFVLRVDSRIMVEQYHYGKIVRQTRAILGKDMPLVEYCESDNRLCSGRIDPFRRPFGLLVDHLEFVVAQARMLDVDSIGQPRGPLPAATVQPSVMTEDASSRR